MKQIIFLTIIIFLVVSVFKAHAINIIDGDLIRAENGIDVYIIKLIGDKQFKRLILNPEIFNQYGHLRWENIKTTTQAEIDTYKISNLVRAVGDDKVYALLPNGDAGEKKWIKTADDFINSDFSWDAIYEINNFERDYYSTGDDWVVPAPCCQPETPAVPETPTPSTPARDPITINVPGGYSTIQAAINAAIDGDTIAVKSGTYNENVVLDKKVKLSGELSGSTIVNGLGSDHALTITNGKDILIERFTFQSKDKYAIYCSGINQITATFKNLIVKDSGRGVVAEENCRLTILNSLIYNNKNSEKTDGAGILVKNNFSYAITTKIINNTIDDNYHGIWSENSNLEIMNNIITNNIGGLGTTGSTGLYHFGNGTSENTYNNVYGNGFDYGGNAVAGNGSIVVYPMFLWPAQRDYHLKTGSVDYSLCLDAGHPDYIYNDGTISTKTYRNDMGAYGGPDNIGWNP